MIVVALSLHKSSSQSLKAAAGQMSMVRQNIGGQKIDHSVVSMVGVGRFMLKIYYTNYHCKHCCVCKTEKWYKARKHACTIEQGWLVSQMLKVLFYEARMSEESYQKCYDVYLLILVKRF